MLFALVGLQLVLQASLAILLYRLRDRINSKRLVVLGLLASLLCWTYWLSDSAFILKHAPNKCAVIVYDLFPLFATGILALLVASRPPSAIRLSVYGMLWVAMNACIFSSVFYTPFRCGNEWSGVCCLQTDNRTCGAAAAATLLKINGIDANEEQMRSACLTGVNGTSFWGLYHGLREYADAAGKSVNADNPSCDEFLARNQPAIVWVMLTREQDARDPRYSRNWGWTVNVAHAVVFLGHDKDGRVCIADPKIGEEKWDAKGLRALWSGKVVDVR